MRIRNLLLTGFMALGTMLSAQQQVEVCGVITNATGISTNVIVTLTDTINQTYNVDTILTDTLGTYCANFELDNLGTDSIAITIEAFVEGCEPVGNGDVFNATVTSDTSFFVEIQNCFTDEISCEASFSYTPTTDGLNFFADANSDQAIVSYDWDFGDGNSGSGETVFHPYLLTGNYHVCVDVTDAVGCVATACDSVYFDAELIVDIEDSCEVVFTITQVPSMDNTYEFIATTVGNGPFDFYWEFSDGTVSTDVSPQHTFTDITDAVVGACLTVTNENQCTANICEELAIDNPNNCQADFTLNYNALNALSGEVEFTNESVVPGSGADVTYHWDFGDGVVSNLENPTHVFENAAVYNICLEISDGAGCEAGVCQEFYIDPSWFNTPVASCTPLVCEANFVPLVDLSNDEVTVYIIDQSCGENLDYTWEVNGEVYTEDFPLVSSNDTGWVEVCLTVSDSISGCTSSFCDGFGMDENGNIIRSEFSWDMVMVQSPGASSGITSVENENQTFFSLTPNPTNNYVSFTTNVNTINNIAILDVQGKLIKLFNENDFSNNKILDLSGLNSGVYLVVVSADSQVLTERLMIK